MKKLNKKGFTLIELLAVITIMGILMLVAIPAVSRTIQNSRRDTFADIAKEYLGSVRNAVLADNIECYSGTPGASGVTASTFSSLVDDTYYFPICTNDTGCSAVGTLTAANIKSSTLDLMESGGKSPFGNADLFGYVKMVKNGSGDKNVKYSIYLSDTGKHGFSEKSEDELKRTNVAMSGVNNTNTVSSAKVCKMS